MQTVYLEVQHMATLLIPAIILPTILPVILATMQGTTSVQHLWEASLRVWINCWRDNGSKAVSFSWSRLSTLIVSLLVRLQGYQYVDLSTIVND
jgi:hypothetical protein